MVILMNTNFNINNKTSMKSDGCFYNHAESSNNKIFNHSFYPELPGQNGRSEYIKSTSTVGVLQDTNYDTSGKNIDKSTTLRNGTMQDFGNRKELDTRLFPGSPLLSSGQSVLKNPNLSSRLKYGDDTRVKKSVNSVSSYSANNFIPLVPEIQENIQNIDHIIPTFWVRGGMSSRTVVRNIDYLKSCGISR
jgi:hypothetical protein